jgi:hypothetical protein
MRSTFEKFGLVGSGVVVGILISVNLSVLAEMVSRRNCLLMICGFLLRFLAKLKAIT